jgi:UDPglucose--hexose-1-phosphate uridylyltransferase
MTSLLDEHPHFRKNPLTGETVLVSPHRLKRPWQGKTEDIPTEKRPEYDENCYLCPGNERAGGARNPMYEGTFVFTNDFAALLEESPDAKTDAGHPLLQAEYEKGTCRVVCFSPRHDLTIAQMEIAQIRQVVSTWIAEFSDLSSTPDINYVQIFENKGEIMGCSNPHPHGQIWATSSIPFEVQREDLHQRVWLEGRGENLLESYATLELQREERLICTNDSWIALVPWWAKWPYEAMLLPKRLIRQLPELTEQEQLGLADIISQLTIKFDNLFNVSFPYTMGFHQAPSDGKDYSHWCLHAHYYPPLLRSAKVQKFMVGFEMLAMPQRDLTPEAAATKLRELSSIHYSKK